MTVFNKHNAAVLPGAYSRLAWEKRLQGVFKVMPYGFKEELFKMLVDKIQHPLRMGKTK
jgi:hypothetical protein